MVRALSLAPCSPPHSPSHSGSTGGDFTGAVDQELRSTHPPICASLRTDHAANRTFCCKKWNIKTLYFVIGITFSSPLFGGCYGAAPFSAEKHSSQRGRRLKTKKYI